MKTAKEENWCQVYLADQQLPRFLEKVDTELAEKMQQDGSALPGQIRVSAARFSPKSYFEGKLNRFTRAVGVAYVLVDAPAHTERSSEGIVYFRGSMALILRGPATVELAFPFSVERLPRDSADLLE